MGKQICTFTERKFFFFPELPSRQVAASPLLDRKARLGVTRNGYSRSKEHTIIGPPPGAKPKTRGGDMDALLGRAFCYVAMCNEKPSESWAPLALGRFALCACTPSPPRSLVNCVSRGSRGKRPRWRTIVWVSRPSWATWPLQPHPSRDFGSSASSPVSAL